MWLIPLPAGQQALTLLIRMLSVTAIVIYIAQHLPWIANASSRSQKWFRYAVTTVALLILSGAYSYYMWPHSKRHILDAKEIAKFQAPLRVSESPNKWVVMACDQNDPVTCEYAAQFMPIFRLAGWKVDALVRRVVLAQPTHGITLVAHSFAKVDPSGWPQPGWNAEPEEYFDICHAFRTIGIEPSQAAGAQVPEGQIVISFGSERPDESVPTNLTTFEEEIIKLKKTDKSFKIYPRVK